MIYFIKNAANALAKGFLSNNFRCQKILNMRKFSQIIQTGISQIRLIVKSPLTDKIKGLGNSFYFSYLKNQEKLKKNTSLLHINEITFKRCQNEGLDITFQTHIIAKVCVIIKYLKNEKNQKLKKMKTGKMAQKWQNGSNLLSCVSSSSKK